MSYLMDNYARLPVAFSHGQGCALYDNHGKRYLDALSGIAVCGLGHAHPELVKALQEQAALLWHTSNLFQIPEQEKAGETLCKLAKMERAYFCNSGTEANEAALKIARLHAHARGIENPQIISFKGGFHGRTYGAMSATANPKIQAGYAPLLSGFVHLPYNDFYALKAYEDDKNIVAIIVETIQGEGGIHIINPDFLKELRDFCHRHDALLIIDEIQTGMARTGKFFSYLHHDVLPDVVTIAKGLANGAPAGATLARGIAGTYFQAGKHGSTFGGTPLITHLINKVLMIYQRDQLDVQAYEKGLYLQEALRTHLKTNQLVKEIRGKGLMLGIELQEPVPNLMLKALEAGLVINVTSEKVIRLLPPLIISYAQLDELVEKITHLLINPFN